MMAGRPWRVEEVSEELPAGWKVMEGGGGF